MRRPIRSRNRRENAGSTRLAALLAAASSLALTQLASGQTWVNPNSSTWSNGANWVGGTAPVSGATTGLVFNLASGQNYNAFNDIANPFVVGSITLGGSGPGTLGLTGSPYQYDGVDRLIRNNLTNGTATLPAQRITSTGLNTDVLKVDGTGSGAVNIAGAVDSTVAPTGTGGGALQMDDPNSTLSLSGGSNLYALRVSQGEMVLNSGNWTVTSTQRQNDPVGVLDDGRWGLNVGEAGAGLTRFTMNGGVLNGQQGFIAVANGSNSAATFNNAAVATFAAATGRFGINAGNGTLNVLGGSTVACRLLELGRQDTNPLVTVNLSGANSRLICGQMVGPRSSGTLNLSITAGGMLDSQVVGAQLGTAFTSSAPAAVANVTINAGTWQSLNTSVISGGGASATGDPFQGGTTTISASNGAQMRAQTWNIGQNNGGTSNITVDGATSVITTVGVGAGTGSWAVSGNLGKLNVGAAPSLVNITLQNSATGGIAANFIGGVAFTGSETNSGGGRTALTVQSGAVLTVGNAFLLTANDDCAGTLTVNNGSISVAGEMDFGSSLNTTAVANITNGGRVVTNNSGSAGFTATDLGSSANITVNNGTLAYASTLVTSGGSATTVGDPLEAGNTTISLSNGARMSAQSMNLGQNAAGFTDVTVDGATTVMTSNGVGAGTGSWATSNNTGFVSTPSTVRLTVRNGATGSLPANLWGSGGITGGDGGVSTFNVQSGGRLNVGGFVILSDPAAAQSHMTVTGSGSQVSIGTSLLVGGNGTLTGGTASFAVTSGAVANVAALTNVYPNSSVTVGSGTQPGSLLNNASGIYVDGTMTFNAGTINSNGTLGVGGTVFLSSAARLPDGTPTNKKTLAVGTVELTSSGVVDLNDNDMLVRGAQPRSAVEGYIAAARNGGAWNAPGITSTAALNNAQGSTTLGVIDGSDYISVQGTVFNGYTVNPGDKVVKYTWYGDTDFNGVVDFDDYVRLDQGFNGGLTGWFNGDFDLSGGVDFDDYVLIDLGFNTQGSTVLGVADALRRAGPGARDIVRYNAIGQAVLPDGTVLTRAAELALAHAEQFGEEYVSSFLSGAVPEPAALGTLTLGTVAGLARRRRRNG